MNCADYGWVEIWEQLHHFSTSFENCPKQQTRTILQTQAMKISPWVLKSRKSSMPLSTARRNNILHIFNSLTTEERQSMQCTSFQAFFCKEEYRFMGGSSCLSPIILSQLGDSDNSWYEHHAITHHSCFVHIHVLVTNRDVMWNCVVGETLSPVNVRF
jgi:hypothetical protein